MSKQTNKNPLGVLEKTWKTLATWSRGCKKITGELKQFPRRLNQSIGINFFPFVYFRAELSNTDCTSQLTLCFQYRQP